MFPTQTLMRDIREARERDTLSSPGIGRGLSDTPRRRGGPATPQEKFDQLTAREREVLQLVAEGNANKQTASDLCISI